MARSIYIHDILNYIDQIAPFKSAEEWDNVGLLIGSEKTQVKRILLALDITDDVINEAILEGYDLIISHHPLIFNSIKSILSSDGVGSKLLKLIENNISVIAAHTNLDCSFELGINAYIAKCLNLKNLKPLSDSHGFGVTGQLSYPMTIEAFAQIVKQVFNIDVVKFANSSLYSNRDSEDDKKLQTIAISSGASADFIIDAINMNADAYITADIKYHDAQTVVGTSLLLVDVGHFESEFVYLTEFKRLLDGLLSEERLSLTIEVTHTEIPIFKYL